MKRCSPRRVNHLYHQMTLRAWIKQRLWQRNEAWSLGWAGAKSWEDVPPDNHKIGWVLGSQYDECNVNPFKARYVMKQRKWLIRCSQKVTRVGKRLDNALSWSLYSPHHCGHLMWTFLRDIRNRVSLYTSLWESYLWRWPIGMQVKEVRESKCRFVRKWIQIFIWRESELTSNWSPVAKEFEELYWRRKANDDFEWN